MKKKYGLISTEEARELSIGTWVKVRWNDADDDWWLVAEIVRKSAKQEYTMMYNPLLGRIESVNHGQFVKIGPIVSIPV